jgi:sugar-specific transcriptional regulator TrmB
MGKPKTFEEAQEQFTAAKEALKAAKEELREFMAENKIKKGATPEDPKILKKFESLTKKVETARETAEGLKESLKELKPKKTRETKYAYPEGMSDKDKKKFRAAQRRAAKGEKAPKEKETGDGEAKTKKPLKKKTQETEED